LSDIIGAYDPDAPLASARTIPAAWYVEPDVLTLERRSVFHTSWQIAARVEQVERPGDFVCADLAGGEPVIVLRGGDGVLRAFMNVCRHRAAMVVTEAHGSARVLRCPYHGWTYSLEGALIGTPEFGGVHHFDPAAHGLAPLDVDAWERWIFVRVSPQGVPLADWLGPVLSGLMTPLRLTDLHWVERRRYTLDCNWKVFVDNYLDGGYHVPHLHKGLASVLDYREYRIDNGERYCVQSSPMLVEGAEPATGAVRTGERARYFWLYPNLMLNCYEGAMDTNVVVPLGVDRTEVVFDFYFLDVSDPADARNRASIAVSEQIQEEDVAICASVQRGLRSGAFMDGRLSVRREAGQHLFHRLLHADLSAGLA
jgi:choline monooxygenase